MKAPIIATSSMGYLSEWVSEYVGNPVNLDNEVGSLSEIVPPLTLWDRINNLLRTKWITYQVNRLISKQNEIVKKYFGPGYPDVLEMQKNLALFLLNYNEAYNGIQTFAPLVKPIAGIHIVENSEDLLPPVNKL